MPTDKEKVHIHLPAELVREGIGYTDRNTGERKTFNVAALPEGCRLGSQDVGGWEFSPLFVNESQFREGWKHIPLLAERDVRLSRTVMEGGRPVIGADGKRVKEQRTADPLDLAEAIADALGLE